VNPSIQLKNTIPVFLIVLAWFGLSPTARGLLPPPPPDGGYPNENTAEGTNALFNVTGGSFNTANGSSALFSNTMGSNNTANGSGALYSNTTGSNNTANGSSALHSNTMGNGNTANGIHALESNTTGGRNTAIGVSALENSSMGSYNTAVGSGALYESTGSRNIALGAGAGSYLMAGSNNIDIGNPGVESEMGTIRIGMEGMQTETFIAGIHYVAVTGTPVVVGPGGRLGVTTSSIRFKDEINPMDKASEAILALKPVIFHYKKEIDPEGVRQFGLVAEEVEKVNPDLVVRDADGKAYTVRYDAVNAMLLNEFLKEHRRNEEQGASIAEQQKEIKALKAELKEQASQIHKVSAQLELSKPAPQTVLNNH
jgi:trimeric autotransporter adhesin